MRRIIKIATHVVHPTLLASLKTGEIQTSNLKLTNWEGRVAVKVQKVVISVRKHLEKGKKYRLQWIKAATVILSNRRKRKGVWKYRRREDAVLRTCLCSQRKRKERLNSSTLVRLSGATKRVEGGGGGNDQGLPNSAVMLCGP